MSWISDIIKGGAEGLIGSVADAADRFITTDAEKQAHKLEVQRLTQNRLSEIEQTIKIELEAKQKIITAELAQGDTYTKRARPTVVYFGLVIIAFNYCLVPLITHFTSKGLLTLNLPTEFWWGWSGIVSTWVVGRSAEKRGSMNNVTSLVTGSKNFNLLE